MIEVDWQENTEDNQPVISRDPWWSSVPLWLQLSNGHVVLEYVSKCNNFMHGGVLFWAYAEIPKRLEQSKIETFKQRIVGNGKTVSLQTPPEKPE